MLRQEPETKQLPPHHWLEQCLQVQAALEPKFAVAGKLQEQIRKRIMLQSCEVS